MKTTSLALTDSRIRLATVVLPEPVPPEIPIIMLTNMIVLETGAAYYRTNKLRG